MTAQQILVPLTPAQANVLDIALSIIETWDAKDWAEMLGDRSALNTLRRAHDSLQVAMVGSHD